jgi:hypothetical protein
MLIYDTGHAKVTKNYRFTIRSNLEQSKSAEEGDEERYKNGGEDVRPCCGKHAVLVD